MHNKMKKAIALSMSVFMIGSCIPAMNIKADNATAANTINSEIINGDFEKGLDGWSVVSGDSKDFSTVVIDTEKGNSLKVAPISDGGTSELGATAWEVQPKTTYMISYDVKVDEYKGLISFTKYEFESDWSLINDAAVYNEGKIEGTTDGWKRISYEFTTSENTGIVQLRLLMNEGGIAYFDNVVMTEKVEGDNIIYNADFSKDNRGWNANGGLDKYEEQIPTIKTVLYSNDFESVAFNNGNHEEEANGKFMHYEKGNAEMNSGVTLNLIPETEYKVSCKLRVNDINGNHNIAISVQEHDSTGYSPLKKISEYYTSNTDDWKVINGSFTAEKENVTIFVICYGDSATNASFDIDDFELYTETTAKKTINLLTEDFEKSNEPNFTNGTKEIVKDDENSYTKFTSTSDDFQGSYAISLKEGSTYRISLDAKSFNGVGSEIYLWLTDWGEKYVDYRFLTEMPELTSEWKTYTFEFKAKRTGSYSLIISKWNNQNSGEAIFGIDNIKIDELTDENQDAVIVSEGYGTDKGYNGQPGLVINSKTNVWNWATGTNDYFKEGKTYTFGYWYKVVGAKEGFSFTPYVHNITSSEIYLSDAVKNNTDWTYVSGEFVAPEKNPTEGIRIGFYRNGEGTVYFSGLTVTEKATVHIHHGHLEIVKEATCQEKGQKEYKCDECKGHVYYDGIAKTGHEYSIKVKTVAPTGTEKGYTEYKCKHCDDTEKRDWTNPKTEETTTKTPVTTVKLKAPSQVKNVKLTAKKKSLKITWKKLSGVKNYQIQLCTSKKFKKGVVKKTASKNSLTVKKLKAKKKYYVRVRAIKTSGKQTAYGKWSKIANKKTK